MCWLQKSIKVFAGQDWMPTLYRVYIPGSTDAPSMAPGMQGLSSVMLRSMLNMAYPVGCTSGATHRHMHSHARNPSCMAACEGHDATATDEYCICMDSMGMGKA